MALIDIRTKAQKKAAEKKLAADMANQPSQALTPSTESVPNTAIAEQRGQAQNNGAATNQGQRVNPEIDAALDKFIADNPKLQQHYMALSKETLVRKVMLPRMLKEQNANKQYERLMSWAKQDPNTLAKVKEVQERQLPAQKEKAIVSAIIGKSMEQKALAQMPGNGPRP
jgi:hypothetical protein